MSQAQLKQLDVRKRLDANVRSVMKSALSEVKRGRASAFAYVIVNCDGKIRFGHTRARDGFALVGGLEDAKHALLHELAHAELP